jgi:hypothetical protein
MYTTGKPASGYKQLAIELESDLDGFGDQDMCIGGHVLG